MKRWGPVDQVFLIYRKHFYSEWPVGFEPPPGEDELFLGRFLQECGLAELEPGRLVLLHSACSSGLVAMNAALRRKHALLEMAGAQIGKDAHILDYGCGQSRLVDVLDLGYPAKLVRYDPAIPEVSTRPAEVFDLLINIDVLEHIEEKDLDEVIADMRSLCRNALIIIDTKLAVTLLADGRNAHVTVRPADWWHARLSRHFPYLEGITTARYTRAGFRTWPRKRGGLPRYAAMRAAETVRYVGNRLVRAGA